jgi:hypothetical protein
MNRDAILFRSVKFAGDKNKAACLISPLVMVLLAVLLTAGVAKAVLNEPRSHEVAGPDPYTITPTSRDINTIVATHHPGTLFSLACGTYRIRTPILPLTGDIFLGAGTINSVPASPPCAIISGGTIISHWTRDSVGEHVVWYKTVRAPDILNIPNGLQVPCMSAGGGVSGKAYLMWTPSTTESVGASIIDANGNTEVARNEGVTGPTNGPAWSTSLNGLTTDNNIMWRLIALGSAGGCAYPQDLFYTPSGDTDIRHSLLKNRTLAWNGGDIGAGNWYTDFEDVGGHGKFTIYVADDPTRFTVELTAALQAFLIRTANVRIQNLTFDKFATPNQHGVVEPEGANDLVAHNWITHSHGEGIELHLPSAIGVVIDSNEVVEMGQGGIDTGNGRNTRITHNRIERNNEDGTAYGYEAGGAKFSNDSNIFVSGNTISCNNGNGLWGDSGEIGAIYSGNAVHRNLYNGITYEISHSGTITRNILTDNAQANACQCVGPHIPLLNSHDVCTGAQACWGLDCTVCTDGRSEIYLHTSDATVVGGSPSVGNTITSNCAGIHMNQDSRLRVRGNSVSYNTLILHTGSAVINTLLGGSNESGPFGFDMYSARPVNFFDHNSYTFDTSIAARIKAQWQWQLGNSTRSHPYNWTGWQAQRQDRNGSVSP